MDDVATRDPLRPQAPDPQDLQLKLLAGLPLALATVRLFDHVPDTPKLHWLLNPFGGHFDVDELPLSTLGVAAHDPLRPPAPGGDQDFQLKLLAGLPLAQATLRLFGHVLDTPTLEGLFDRFRGRCYERDLRFSTMVYLLRDALLPQKPSGRRSFVQAQTKQDLPVSIRAVYGKLGRMSLAVSQALLHQSYQPLRDCLPEVCGPEVMPPSLRGFWSLVFDGKTLKHVEKRLMQIRVRRGKVNSGKMLVALDLGTGLAVGFQASRNSEANDVSLVAGLLEQLASADRGRIRLYLCDRQFCDLPRLRAFAAGGHHFVVRHNRNLRFHADPQRPAIQSIDRRGRTLIDEWGWLGRVDHPQRLYVRRTTVKRPGEEEVSVVSDLLDPVAYPAEELLDAYLGRWGIERVFQQITSVFNLRSLIGGDPRATVFQASMCLLMYNVLQVVRGYVAQAGQRPVCEVSTENLFTDCREELIAWAKLGDPRATAELLSATDVSQTRAALARVLAKCWNPWWQKAPAQPNRRRTPKTVYPRKGYTNVGKVLDEAAAARRPAKRRR